MTINMTIRSRAYPNGYPEPKPIKKITKAAKPKSPLEPFCKSIKCISNGMRKTGNMIDCYGCKAYQIMKYRGAI